jgi:protease I
MKKLIIPILIIVLGVTGFLIFKGQTKREKILPPKIETKMPETKGKKAVMLIAFRDFRDEEYFVTKEILEKAGIEIKTASNKMGRAIGKFGGDTEVDLLVSQINVSDFDAIIFVGGPGCLDALDNEESYRIAREAVSQNKVLAAICISPVILARAGVLRGKRATVWNDFVKSQAKILKREGAIFEDKPVVVDGKIVTANGPEAAKDFGEAILSLLK